MASDEEFPFQNLIKNSGSRPFIPKGNKLDPIFFDDKFSKALLKTLELKGMNLSITSSSHEPIHQPQIDSLPQDIQVNLFKNSEKNLGLITFDSHFLSELIHKMMGGSDNISPGPLKLPLGPLQQKTMESIFPALANCLREGVKNVLGLESLKLQSVIEGHEAQDYLNKGGDCFHFNYSFAGLTESSMSVLLFINNFNG